MPVVAHCLSTEAHPPEDAFPHQYDPAGWPSVRRSGSHSSQTPPIPEVYSVYIPESFFTTPGEAHAEGIEAAHCDTADVRGVMCSCVHGVHNLCAAAAAAAV